MYLPSSLFIIFLSLNVCTARPLITAQEASNTQINISRKVSENGKKQQIELRGMTKSEGIKAMGAEIEESSKHMKKVHLNEALESSDEQKEILGFVPVKSVVLVSWHVPLTKQDHNTVFHSDYARPRTNPPSHN